MVEMRFPILGWQECSICEKEFRFQWLWLLPVTRFYFCLSCCKDKSDVREWYKQHISSHVIGDVVIPAQEDLEFKS